MPKIVQNNIKKIRRLFYKLQKTSQNLVWLINNFHYTSLQIYCKISENENNELFIKIRDNSRHKF